jgi:hypothetical protein
MGIRVLPLFITFVQLHPTAVGRNTKEEFVRNGTKYLKEATESAMNFMKEEQHILNKNRGTKRTSYLNMIS